MKENQGRTMATMWHNCTQNSEDICPCCDKTWMQLRAGKVTGSSLSKIMANYGKAFGEPAKNLAVDIASFELGGSMPTDNYTNTHMERGHEEEPIIRMLYEETFFCDVTNGGFYDNGQTGASPDGRVSEDGLVEIKSAIAGVHYRRIKRGTLDPAYRWQCVFELKESDREWLDFISFCSTFPKDNRLFVFRIHRQNVRDDFKMIDTRLLEFRKLIEQIKTDIKGK